MTSYESTQGRIFDIQRYSIHDGPGVRTIVFLKGCGLRCLWCCNPESQSYEIQQMTQAGTEKTVGRDVSAGEVMQTVLRDMPYYSRSGGGITLSGGEAMLQPDFAEALLVCSRSHGIHTAVETAGFVPTENYSRLLPHIDLVLMDIKHMNSEKHRRFTSQPNRLILENAGYIASNAKQLIIRVPVIPGFNDTPAEISDIARFANSLPGVTHLHLLPYHRLGQDKYAGLGRPYGLDGVPVIEDIKMRTLLSEAEKSGLICQIGG